MLRLLLCTCLVLALAACSGEVKRARLLLEDSLPISKDIQYRELKRYPGSAVCGEFKGFVAPYIPMKEFQPFIVLGEQVINPPQARQLAIYCHREPAEALLAETGIGLFTAESTALAQVTEDLYALDLALEAYYQANSRFPTAQQTLQQLVTPSGIGRPPRSFPAGGYLQSIPLDPWGEPYRYEEEQWGRTKGQFRVYTLGADKAPGGSGDNADVGSDSLPYLRHVARVLGLGD